MYAYQNRTSARASDLAQRQQRARQKWSNTMSQPTTMTKEAAISKMGTYLDWLAQRRPDGERLTKLAAEFKDKNNLPEAIKVAYPYLSADMVDKLAHRLVHHFKEKLEKAAMYGQGGSSHPSAGMGSTGGGTGMRMAPSTSSTSTMGMPKMSAADIALEQMYGKEALGFGGLAGIGAGVGGVGGYATSPEEHKGEGTARGAIQGAGAGLGAGVGGAAGAVGSVLHSALKDYLNHYSTAPKAMPSDRAEMIKHTLMMLAGGTLGGFGGQGISRALMGRPSWERKKKEPKAASVALEQMYGKESAGFGDLQARMQNVPLPKPTVAGPMLKRPPARTGANGPAARPAVSQSPLKARLQNAPLPKPTVAGPMLKRPPQQPAPKTQGHGPMPARYGPTPQ
jgi:hypothetical protein